MVMVMEVSWVRKPLKVHSQIYKPINWEYT